MPTFLHKGGLKIPSWQMSTKTSLSYIVARELTWQVTQMMTSCAVQ